MARPASSHREEFKRNDCAGLVLFAMQMMVQRDTIIITRFEYLKFKGWELSLFNKDRMR